MNKKQWNEAHERSRQWVASLTHDELVTAHAEHDAYAREYGPDAVNDDIRALIQEELHRRAQSQTA